MKLPSRLRKSLDAIVVSELVSEKTANEVAARYIVEGIRQELGSGNLLESHEMLKKLMEGISTD